MSTAPNAPHSARHLAIIDAHHESDCDDYYCGCWDSTYPQHDLCHTTAFLAALNAAGYDVVAI